jgi:hypothetical protein
MNDALERRGIMNIGGVAWRGVAWGYIMTDILSFIHSYV